MINLQHIGQISIGLTASMIGKVDDDAQQFSGTLAKSIQKAFSSIASESVAVNTYFTLSESVVVPGGGTTRKVNVFSDSDPNAMLTLLGSNEDLAYVAALLVNNTSNDTIEMAADSLLSRSLFFMDAASTVKILLPPGAMLLLVNPNPVAYTITSAKQDLVFTSQGIASATIEVIVIGSRIIAP